MSTVQQAALRFRLVLLTFALSCLAAGALGLAVNLIVDEPDTGVLLVSGWTAWFLSGIESGDGVPMMLHHDLFFGAILLAHWLFLRPRRDWRVQLAETARPMKSAIAVAAFMAMLLSVGAIAIVFEALDGNLWLALENVAERISDVPDDSAWTLWPWWTLLLAVWLAWAAVFFVHWREGERAGRLGRMVAALVGGSVLEFLVSIGVYAWNPQNDNCWCGRGSFTGLVFATTVLIWAFGPGLLLLFLRRQRDAARRRASRAP